jgi:hypothetical protein
MALPNSINYNDIPDALKDDVTSTTIVLNPVNSKATFESGDIIIFDYMTSRGFIDPKSIYLSYKVTATNAINLNQYGYILGCPAYSPFLRVDTIINSQTIESVNQWNQECNFWINCNLSVADKAGLQYALGYNETAADNGTLIPFDGRRLTSSNDNAVAQSYYISCPLICNILSGCTKLIPSFLMPSIRQQFTIDARTNFVDDIAKVTAFSISNIQITYQLIDFGSEIQNMIMNMPKFIIKSEGWSNSSTTIPTGAVGSQSIVYNQRYASIKAATIIPNFTATYNKSFDSYDITRGGSYQIQIGNLLYPQLSLNATTNKAFLQELRRSQGNLYDFKNSMSINSIEFEILENGAPAYTQPGKFYIGIDTTKLGSGSTKNLLNGTSSQNSPINVLLNIANATTAARNLNLVLNYDALIEIDPSTSMVSARV